MRKLARFGIAALALSWPHRRAGSDIMLAERITVVLVSDRRIARLHQRFCGVAGPTDVLTFQDGDIFISADTAEANARCYQTSAVAEIRLYLAHGLLHLCGWNDQTARDAREMERRQMRLLRAALGKTKAPV